MEIIKIGVDDLAQLQLIGRQSFRETFESDNSEEDMQKYLQDAFSVDQLTAELSDPNTAFYFAVQDDEVLGYLKINFGPAQTVVQSAKTVEIERIYVLRAWHGKQIGQVLFELARNVAQSINADYLWLGVWERNARAINFYKKNGFVEFDKHIFKLGNDEQTDIMMKLSL